MLEDVPELSIARDEGAAPAGRCVAPLLRLLHPGVTIDGAPYARDALLQNRRRIQGRPSLVLLDPVSFASPRGRNAH
jgi:hypothetical protein